MVCDSVSDIDDLFFISLNPYSIGIWSATSMSMNKEYLRARLNPYSIGIWSATKSPRSGKLFFSCLNPYSIGIWSATWH